MSAAEKQLEADTGEEREIFFDRKRAGEFLGLSEHWFHKHHSDPDAPPFIKAGRKAWYRKSDLEAFCKKRALAQKSGDMLTKANTGRRTVLPSFESVKRKFEEISNKRERRNLEGEQALKHAIAVLLNHYSTTYGERK